MRYTDGPDGSWKGRRPEGIPAENVETELIEVLEPSLSHNCYKGLEVNLYTYWHHKFAPNRAVFYLV